VTGVGPNETANLPDEGWFLPLAKSARNPNSAKTAASLNPVKVDPFFGAGGGGGASMAAHDAGKNPRCKVR
jgi:hypothetical protein